MKTSCFFLAAAVFGLLCLQAAWADSNCEAKSGTCQYVNAATCDGMYERGLCSGSSTRLCCAPISCCTVVQKSLACQLVNSSNVVARTTHESGITDNANALQNLEDMCSGGRASRSSYQSTCACSAPGGSLCLSEQLLSYLHVLSQNGTVTITELAGGCHSCYSFHYAGLAVDLSWSDNRSAEYVAKCNEMGGTGIDETSHVHCHF